MCAQHHHLVPVSSLLSEEQRRWLRTGVHQPGGKLPRVLDTGERISFALMRECLQAGWVEPWSANPVLDKEDIRICRLTENGRRALEQDSVIRVDFTQWKKDAPQSVQQKRPVTTICDSSKMVSAVAGLRFQEDLSPRG